MLRLIDKTPGRSPEAITARLISYLIDGCVSIVLQLSHSEGRCFGVSVDAPITRLSVHVVPSHSGQREFPNGTTPSDF